MHLLTVVKVLQRLVIQVLIVWLLQLVQVVLGEMVSLEELAAYMLEAYSDMDMGSLFKVLLLECCRRSFGLTNQAQTIVL